MPSKITLELIPSLVMTSLVSGLTVTSGIAYAQDAPVQTPPASTPGAQTPTVPFSQPSAKTPPTPLPKDAPKTDPFGVKASDVKPIGVFRKQVPGQPQEGDPTSIHTLEEAVAVALRRSPTILTAEERAVRTLHTVRQIVGGNGPQFSLSGSYSRLSANGASAITSGGLNPGSIQNPFSVGLQTTPPGSAPVTLSGTSTAGSTQSGNTGQTSATGASTSGSAGAAGQSRAESTPESGTSRQVSGGGNVFNQQGASLNQDSVRAQITQFIDITGIFRTAVQVGQLEEALTRLEIARLRQDVALTVRTAYYNLLRAQAFVRVNEASVAQSEELLRVTEAQRNAGVAAEYDVLQARTQLDNNRQALISARNQVSISRNSLANTLGIDPSTPVDPTSPPVPPMPQLDEQALVNKAMQQRPEYYQADINLLKADKNIRLARRTLEPFLNAVASGNYNANQVGGFDKGTASVGVVLAVPLWDGGATREAIEVARSDQRSALVTKDQYVRGIKAEVQQAIIAIRDANERAQATSQTVTQAREALRLANVRYRAGVDTQLSVNNAQTTLTQAETNAVNAQFDYLAALARLSRAVGNPE